jgi:16S rRNA (adenine1518-N6/adenine1519-N6)-dimethyltransferase
MPSLAVETRRILRAHGLHPKKTLGQNFLIDREALQSVVSAAEVRPGDVVLEIGPGVGTLTTELADQGAEVVAVELDERLADVLAERTARGRHVRVVRGNALHLDLAPLLPAGEHFKLVANIPYYITAPILRHFLEGPWRPALIVLMVQKEVAERLAAQPGNMSLLGVMAQFYARVEIVRVVPASSFLPAPQVDSAIVRLRRHEMPPVTVDNVDRFFKVVKAGFAEKRKQLHNALVRGLAHIPATQIDAALEQAGIDRTRRAETLNLEEWGRLYQALNRQSTAEG